MREDPMLEPPQRDDHCEVEDCEDHADRDGLCDWHEEAERESHMERLWEMETGR